MLKRINGIFILAFVCACLSIPHNAMFARGLGKAVVKIQTENKTYEIQDGELRYLYYEPECDNISGIVDTIYNETFVAAKNAAYRFEGDKVEVTAEKSGKKIDKNKLFDDIKICLAAGGGTISANYIVIEPCYTQKDFPDEIVLRGKFSTDFSGSQEGRIHNINLAAEMLNGITVYRGEVFSFNDCVGVRSEKNGFKNAKVIVGGRYVDGVGGGVCQVSSTLYNAALLSGLDVIEQHRHTLAVNYVEKSFDAMVSYGYADLKILNCSAAPIFIRGYVDETKVCFEVYGQYSALKIERESVVTKIIEPAIQTVETSALCAGERKMTVFPKRGYESEGYLVITENENVFKKFLRKDTYQKVDGVVEVGK